MTRKRKQNNNGITTPERSGLALAGKEHSKLKITALENWLWDTAYVLFGETGAALLPLLQLEA